MKLRNEGELKEPEWKIIRVLKDRLDKYISEKESFIAEILTEPLVTTKRMMLYRDVILGLVQNTLFMDNIAANEGIQYLDLTQNRLKIRVFREIDDTVYELSAVFSCAPGAFHAYSIKYPFVGFPYSAHCNAHQHSPHPYHLTPKMPDVLQISSINSESRSKVVELLHQELDVEFELPGPLGEHAFYGFLENLIRNTAKHQKPSKNVEIRMRVSEPQDEKEKDLFYSIEIWDNITDPDSEMEFSVDGDSHRRLYESMATIIQTPLITKTGEIKPQAWGISEMKVDAALLAGSTDWMRLEQFLEAKKAWEILDGNLVADEPTSGDAQARLVYQFRLMKPKKLCALLSNPLDKERITEFKGHGLWIFTEIDDLENQLKDAQKFTHGKFQPIASFEIAFLDLRSTADIRKASQQVHKLIPYLPFRVVAIGDEALRNLLPNGVQLCTRAHWLDLFNSSENIKNLSHKIMEAVWVEWLGRWEIEKRQAHVHVYLQQLDQNQPPTKQWLDFANSFNIKQHPVKLVVWAGEKGKIDGDFTDRFEQRALTQIVYDRHGGLQEKLNYEFHFYERIEKQNPDFVLFFIPKMDDEGGEIINITPHPFELAEAGLLRILVIDERIAERVGEIVYNTPRGFCAAEAGIFIVTHFGYDKEPEPLHGQVEKEESKVEFPVLKLKAEPFADANDGLCLKYSGVINDHYSRYGFDCRFDMIIIHQGVLQTHFKTEDEQYRFLGALSKEIPFVVIDSGRGVPPEIQKYKPIKFLPFPILEQGLLGPDVAKLRFATVVMKLTRRGE